MVLIIRAILFALYIKLVIVYLIVFYYIDNYNNSRANTC